MDVMEAFEKGLFKPLMSNGAQSTEWIHLIYHMIVRFRDFRAAQNGGSSEIFAYDFFVRQANSA
jgi:hypothetical protein